MHAHHYGSTKVISYHKNIVGIDFQFQSTRSVERLNTEKINIVNCWQENVNITLGKMNDVSGKYALMSLEGAMNDLKKGIIDAIVTAPINKSAMQKANFPYKGHTEYLTDQFKVEESLMFLISESMKVGVVTNHLPLKDVTKAITKDKIVKKLQIMNEALKVDFGKERPTIAVLGLNPHAGDDGLLGEEEEKIIRPAVIESKKKGILAMGPFAADGFFGSGQFSKFDGILAMYHDQGLIPFKALSFGKGVNYTAGLPGVRTSPDHGTAYELEGKNEADTNSFRHALYAAIDIARNRKNYLDAHKDPLMKKEKPMEAGEG